MTHNLMRYSPNLGNYDVNYVQGSESGAYGQWLEESLHSDNNRAPVSHTLPGGIADFTGMHANEPVYAVSLRYVLRGSLTPAEWREPDEGVAKLRSTPDPDFIHMNRVGMMGELAASLAHEILHPIATARNNARASVRFLEMSPPNLDEVRKALDCVVKDVDRARDIVDRMRDHIKKAPPRREPFDLNEAVSEVIVMVRSAITTNGIAVRTHLKNGLVSVQGDRVQLQQVLENLILNAVDAMSSIDAGVRELSIMTRQEQTQVLVAVGDSGPGIAREHLDRVFKPFYTTKPNGTGMGLTICRSIIEAHGGRLWASANVPRGAMFQFTVPADSDITS